MGDLQDTWRGQGTGGIGGIGGLGGNKYHWVRFWYGQQRIDTGYLVAREQRWTNHLGGGVGCY